jgi:hypothetical protein
MTEKRYCQHANCRLDTAVELAYMGSLLLRKDLLILAGQVNESTVRCRLVPRKGPIHAPLPTRRETCR